MHAGSPIGTPSLSEKQREGPEPSKSSSSISATNQVGELATQEGLTPINHRVKARKEANEWLEGAFEEAIMKVLSGEVDPECPKFLTWDAAVDEVKQSNNRSL